MTATILGKRLAALEAIHPMAPFRLTPEEREEATRRYEATLHEDGLRTPEAAAYFARATLHQLASDYDAMLKGVPAPWEQSA